MTTAPEAPLKTKYQTVDTDEVIAGLPEIPKLVITKAAFRHLDDTLWDLLVSDQWIETFADHTKFFCADLNTQLAEAKVNELPRDPDWERRVLKVKARVERLNSYLSLMARNYHRRLEGVKRSDLLKAIRLHQATTLSEFEPTAADQELWRVLE